MSLLSKAVKHAQHEAQNAVDAATGAVQGAAQDVADELGRFGKRVVNAWRDVAKAVVRLYDDNTIAIRGLHHREKDVLRSVYWSSLPPLDNILIISLIGIQNRPFTLPSSFLVAASMLLNPAASLPLTLEALALMTAKRQDLYLLFMGRHGYNDAVEGFPFDGAGNPLTPGEVLVHEACHVWQGYRHAFTWWYIVNSVYCQGRELTHGRPAYDYDRKNLKRWDRYEAEQQASIVEDWFAGRDRNNNFPFIRDNIRPGRPHARTKF
jgi:hypothetical protein